MKDYEPERLKEEMEHPVDEGCAAQDHEKKMVGVMIPVSKIWNFISGKIKWGWR